MPKTIHTPRDELICGKLDRAREYAAMLPSVTLCELLDDIRHDAERMEAKLVSRKDEAATHQSAVRELVGALKECLDFMQSGDDGDSILDEVSDLIEKYDVKKDADEHGKE